MFAKSARFHSQTNEAPGPGDYDPQDAHRRGHGLLNFAADGVPRFAAEKEQEAKLGPGYYVTPRKLDAFVKRRVSITNSTFTDAHKKMGELSASWAAEKKVFEDIINELSVKLREAEKSLKAQCSQQEAEAHREEVRCLLAKIATLEEAHKVLKETTTNQLMDLEAKLREQIEQCSQLNAQICLNAQDSETHRSEIQDLRQQLASSQSSLEETQILCAQTQESLKVNNKQLQEQNALCAHLQQGLEDTSRQLEESQKYSEEQHSLHLRAQEELNRLEQLRQDQSRQATSELEAEVQRTRTCQEELTRKAAALEACTNDCDSLRVEVQMKQQDICNLEAKIFSMQLMLTASQETQQQLNEANHLLSELEATSANKEAQWNAHLVEFKSRVDKLMLQLKKKNATILDQKARIDKLVEDQGVLQQQKALAEQQFAVQLQQAQENLRQSQEQLSTQAMDYQMQVSQAQETLETVRMELVGQVATLTDNLATASAKVAALETEVQARNEQLASVSEEAKQAQANLTREVELLTHELSTLKGNTETLQQLLQESSQARSQADDMLTQEKAERMSEANSHIQEVLELQAIMHQNQERNEHLLAALGSSEVQVQELLAKIHVAELHATSNAAQLAEYETKLSAEVSKCENFVVRLATTEMEMESNKSELVSSTQLATELRERLLAEQTLASDFESKFKTELSTNADLRQALMQSEALASKQKAELLDLTVSLDEQKASLLHAQQEWAHKQNLHKHELAEVTSDLQLQREKHERLAQSWDEQRRQLSHQADEQRAETNRLQALVERLKSDLLSQCAEYEKAAAEQASRAQVLEEKIAASNAVSNTLTDEIASLKRAQLIDKLANERAVNAAMANMDLAQQELSNTRALCEERGVQIAKLDQALAAASQNADSLQQQLKKAVDSKTEATKSYTSLLKSFYDISAKYEEKEAAVVDLETKAKSQQEEFAKYKDSTKSLVQENGELMEEYERLYKFADENKEAAATITALRVKVDELENANRDLQASLSVLDDEARETSSQNTLLVGHNNQKQKINIHAKVTAENRRLKLENIRLANACHELKKAAVSSVVVDAENIAPTLVDSVRKPSETPSSVRAKAARKQSDLEDENSKLGPLQQSFKNWQQKKQKSLGQAAGKRTPLAQLNGVPSGRAALTPRKLEV